MPLHSLPVPPDSICVLRLSAIGDIVHMVPVVRTLQHHWPDCKITWIIGKLEATLVGDLPGVEFIIFDKSAGLKSLNALRRQLRGRRFSLLLHMQVALRASLISLMVDAPVKLGFDRARAHDFQWLFSNCRIDSQPQQHVLDGFFGFLQTLGIQERMLEWELPVPEEARAFVDNRVPDTRPVLVINPCSSARLRNYRNWPAERYAAVADYADERHGLQVVLSGGPDVAERHVAERICRQARAPLINLVGQTSLKALLALLQRAAALIAPDTGPAHIATAAGTPVIGLYASSNPARTGPYLSRHWVIDQYAEALRRYARKRVTDARWGERVRHPDVMNLISVEQVQEALNRLMAIRESAAIDPPADTHPGLPEN